MCSLLLVLSLFLKASAQSTPEFASNMSVVYVAEDTMKGAEAYKLLAFDKDNDLLTYSMSGADSIFFKLNETTGIVTVARTLDRETRAILQVTIGVTDGSNPNEMEQTIILEDANDNPPVFLSASYTGSVYENETEGATLFTVKAVDSDLGAAGAVRYKIVEVLPGAPTLFGIQQNGSVILNGTLSYAEKSTYYQLKIEASDHGGMYLGKYVIRKNFAFAFINVEDVPDRNPIFLNIPYQTTVPENSSVGTTVFQVLATDGDQGIKDEITYSIQRQTNSSKLQHLFNIDARSGDIYVSGFLNREELLDFNTVVELQVTAKEQHLDINGAVASAVTSVSITVTDINDNTPAFYNCNLDFCNFTEGAKVNSFKTSIPEHISAGVPIESLTIVARDPDQGMNGTFILFLHGEGASIFTVHPQDIKNMGMVQIIVRNSSAIDYEQRHDINITDENDNSPVFTKSVYNASVVEHTLGAFVTLVKASDNDATEINNRVIYRIETGSTGTFLIRTMLINKIDPKQYQGNITVDPTIALDYDKGPKSYTLGISASDSGFPSKSASATVYVSVLDMNDETPVLDPDSLKDLDVMENNTQLGIVRNITASDIDTNHSLIYQLVSVVCLKSKIIDARPNAPCRYWFGLYDNGSLYVNESSVIDYEVYDQADITIRVTDLYTEKNNPSTTGKLTINIVDVNDNVPVFLAFERVSVIVPELAPISAEVATVKASDNDTGKNAEINFVVTKVLFIFSDGQENKLPDVFEASRATLVGGEYTATIKIKSSLDKTLRGQYKVTIEARDGGKPTLSATRDLNLITVDESYKTRLEFGVTPDEVQRNMNEIIAILREATYSNPYVAGVNAVSNEKVQRLARNTAKAIMEVYFVYNNGTAIPPENINSILQFNPEAVKELIDIGLLNIKEPAEPIDTARPLLFTIGGLVAAFILLVAIMITIVVCSRQSYERKIKSITAMNTAKTITVDALQNGPVVPGTNKYTSEGANPVWNTNIEVSADLGFEDANSDRVSINSLDVNIVDGMQETPTRKLNVEMAEQTINSHPVDEKTKPLSVALDDHDNNKEKTSGETGNGIYNKAILNSTDI
ncbi:hypothetical protein scyTo_0003100 [Scyliorhinus torazame]|uniref:Cadherin domain-containing protein n=1 Tax=Scyliorhinus torazame TaxID=75743 RepID=A0A401PLK2_SCYTO|nr:hypothetical protein [Scyliorhinus torazame]